MQVADAKELDRIVKEINECIMQGAQRFLRIGQLLKKVKDEELWQLSEAISFSDFAEKAVHLKKSQAYAAISVHHATPPKPNIPKSQTISPPRLHQHITHQHTIGENSREYSPKTGENHQKKLDKYFFTSQTTTNNIYKDATKDRANYGSTGN